MGRASIRFDRFVDELFCASELNANQRPSCDQRAGPGYGRGHFLSWTSLPPRGSADVPHRNTKAMKLTLGLLIAANLMAAGADCVTVDLAPGNAVSLSEFHLARLTATRLYAAIGVSLDWKPYESRHACVLILIVFREHDPASLRPTALALAAPFRETGTQIQVFIDRVAFWARNHRAIPLGYVLAHEIGHVLEGTDAHADEGVMKARWTTADHGHMMAGTLSFSPEDASRIHGGFVRRHEQQLEGAWSMDVLGDPGSSTVKRGLRRHGKIQWTDSPNRQQSSRD